MALKPLNSLGGFSIGTTPANIILANGDITTTRATFTGNLIAGSGNLAFDSTLNRLTVSGNIATQNANLGNIATANFFQGVITVASANQPNITQVGTLTSLTVSGNTLTSNILAIGNITASNFIGNLIGNISGNVTAPGNVNEIQFKGTSNLLSTSANFTFNPTTSAFLVTGTSNVTGNAVVGNLSTLGTISAAGNISAPTFIGNVVASGNISGNYIFGNGAFLTGIDTSQIANGTSNVRIAAAAGNVLMSVNGQSNVVVASSGATSLTTTGNIVAPTFIGNVSATTISATGNVTSGNLVTTGAATVAGTLTAGNIVVLGNLAVSGNLTYVNAQSIQIQDPIIELGGGANGALLTGPDSNDRGTLLHYYTTQPVDAFMGWDNSNAEFTFGSNVSVSNNVVTYNTLGNVRAATFIGNISGNISAPGANTQVLFNSGNVVSANTGLTFNSVTGTLTANVIAVTTNTKITASNVTTTAVTANAVIAQFPVTGVTGVEYLVKGVEGTKYGVAKVIAVTDGTNVDHTIFSTVELGASTGILSLAVDVSGGNIRLLVTPTSAAATLWITQYTLI